MLLVFHRPSPSPITHAQAVKEVCPPPEAAPATEPTARAAPRLKAEDQRSRILQPPSSGLAIAIGEFDAREGEGNFPPRNSLKSPKTGKESRNSTRAQAEGIFLLSNVAAACPLACFPTGADENRGARSPGPSIHPTAPFRACRPSAGDSRAGPCSHTSHN